MKNKPFIAWNGNALPWNDIYGYVAVGFLLLILFSFIFTKKFITNVFSKEKLLGLSKKWFWRVLGIVLLAWYLLRQIFYFGSGYPLYWEALSLHICRIHYLLISLMLIFNQTKWMKNLMPISVMGSIFGIFFGKFSNDFINHYQEIPGVNWHALTSSEIQSTWSSYASLHGYKTRIETIDLAVIKSGVHHYSVGPDSFHFYDFYIAHYAIAIIPLVVFCAKKETFKFDDVIKSLMFYTPLMLLLWSLNIATKNAPLAWRMNNWYMAPNSSNPHYDAIGWGSMWPQNLFVYWIVGSFFVFIFPQIWILQSKIEFFNQQNFFTIIQNENWAIYKKTTKDNLLTRFWRTKIIKH